MRLARGTVFAGVVVSCSAPFLCAAQDADEAGADAAIEGAWVFETAPYEGGCVIDGSIVIEPVDDTGAYPCRFTATETCPWRSQYGRPASYDTVQVCAITRDGADIRIESTLISVDPPTSAYAPDHFIAVIESGTLMRGQLRSADVSRVTFVRDSGLSS